MSPKPTPTLTQFPLFSQKAVGSLPKNARLKSWFAAVFAGAMWLSVSGLQAQSTVIWDGGGGATTTWSDNANWTTSAPTSHTGTFVTLGLPTATTPNQNIANPFLLSQLNILGNGTTALTGSALQFTGNTGAGHYHINGTGSGAVTIANEIRATYAASGDRFQVGSGAGGLTLNGNLLLSTSLGTIFRGTNAIRVNGRITDETGLASASFSVTDGVTLTLNNSANLIGTILMNQGTLVLGSSSGLGTVGNLRLGQSDVNNARFNMNGFSQTVGGLDFVASIGAGTRIISNLNSNATSTLTYNRSAGSGNQSFAGVIGDTAGSADDIIFIKQGTNTLTLTGTNTYTGRTEIQGGILSASNLNGGSSNSNIGRSSTAASNLVLNGGTLQYTGAGQTTDRSFSVGTSGGGLDASGSGALVINSTAAMGFNSQLGTRTLTLTGTNVGDNILNAVIGNDGSNATSLVKNGAGKWILTGANTYTGGTTISAGTLQIGNGGTVGQISGNITNNAALVINRSNGYVISGDLSGSGTLTHSGTAALELAGNNSGMTGSVVNNTNQLITLSSVNSGSADAAFNLAVSGGSLNFTVVGGTAHLGSLTGIAGTVLRAGGSLGGTMTFSIGALGTSTGFAGNITNNGAGILAAVTKVGGGTLTLSGSNNYTGGTIVNAGTLAIGASDRLADTGSVTVNAGAFNIGTFNDTVGAVTLTGGSITGSGGILTGSSYAVESGSVSAILAGAVNLDKTTGGTVALTGANTYSGTTTLSAGVLQAGNDAAFGTSALALNGGTLSSDSGTARAFSNAVTFGGDVTLGNGTQNGTLTFNGAGTLTGNRIITTDSNVTYAGAIGGGANGLTKAGAGDLEFSAVNTYTGSTIVSGGTLILSGSGSVASNLIQVQQGASLNASGLAGGLQLQSGQTLQNKGTFTGNLTALSGSTYAPGNSPGIANQAGDLTLNTGSFFEWELVANTTADAGINFDQTDFSTGGLTIQTGVTAKLVFNFTGSTVNWANAFWSTDQEWLVFSGAGSLSSVPGIFTTLNVGMDSVGNSLAPSQGSFSFTSVGNDVYLTYSAIPEPSTTLLLAGALTALVIFRRRRH